MIQIEKRPKSRNNAVMFVPVFSNPINPLYTLSEPQCQLKQHPLKNWPLYYRMDICLMTFCLCLDWRDSNFESLCIYHWFIGWTLGVSLYKIYVKPIVWSVYLCSIRNTLPLLPSLCCIVPCCLYPFFLYDVNSKNDLKNGWSGLVISESISIWFQFDFINSLHHRGRVLIFWVWFIGDFSFWDFFTFWIQRSHWQFIDHS